MGVLDDILKRRRGTMTRQEAVAPSPQQAIAQTSQTIPQSAGTVNQEQQAAKPGYIVFQTETPGIKNRYKLGVPGATVYPAGVPHLDEKPQPSLGGTKQPANGTVEIPRRTHQSAGGGAMPVRSAVQPVQATTPQPQQISGTVNQAGAAQQPQVADMNEMLAYLARDSKQKLDDVTETPEQKAAREKREKRQALMAKIGDGLGAFHEAYSHMMGTKPMTRGSLSAAQEARVKALGLERDKKYKDALDNYIKVLETQRKNDYYNSIAETRRAEQESRDAARRDKEAREREKLDLQKLLREDKQRTAGEKSSFWDAYWYARDVEGRSEEDAKRYASEYSFKVREQENANEQALNDAKVKKEESATQKNQAQAAKAKSSGSGRGKSSSSYTTTTTTYDKNGKVKGTKVTTKTPGGSRSSKKPTSKGKKKTNVKWK